MYPISGYGPKTIDIPSDEIPRNPFHYIIVEAFKGDLSKGPEITVEILKDGIIVNQNTSEGGIRHYSQIYPAGKPAIAGYLAGSWEEYNQNPDSIEELKAVYNKEPAWGNEKVTLRKQLGLPLDP